MKTKISREHLRPEIRTLADADVMHAQILHAATKTIQWLRDVDDEPLMLLRRLRFETVGFDPLTGDPLNVVEQLNQTFTILVCLRAVEDLLQLHPEAEGFRLALGTASGRDIESIAPNVVAAEAFSATHPNSNQKLRKDIRRLASDTALNRYVFFAAPSYDRGRQSQLEVASSGVKVYAVKP